MSLSRSYETPVTGDGSLLHRSRREALHGLVVNLSPRHVEGARRCAARLRERLPHRNALQRNKVLVAYGGGKDSTYTVAFVRLMQLLLHGIHGDTFRMRVATN